MPRLIALSKWEYFTWLPFILTLAASSLSYGGEPVDVAPAQMAIKNYTDALTKNQEYLRNLINAEKERRGPCVETLMNIQARESDTKPALDTLDRQLSLLSDKLKPVIDLDKEAASRQEQLKKLETESQRVARQLKDLENRKIQLAGDVDAAKQNLAAINRESKEKIADWMIQNYNKLFAKSDPINTPTQTIQDLHTLFGVYTIVSPRKLEPREKSQTSVRFTPAIFTKDLFQVSIKTGPVATSVTVPAGLEFKPGRVLGSFGPRDFDLSEKDLVEIDPPNSITWNWQSNATEEFAGAKFDIQMLAKLDKTKDSKKASLDLPVAIEMDPGKPFLERFQALIGTGIGAVWSLIVALISATLSAVLTHKLTVRRGRPPPPEKPSILVP